MEHQFWHEKWEENDLGFHREDYNPVLVDNWPALEIAQGSRVFVPLCGKSRDMAWLLRQGHRVLGVELSEIAARSFLEESGLQAQRDRCGPFVRYRTEQLELLCGDFFSLEPEHLSDVVAVYDRASLIALPPGQRAQYAAKMRTLLRPGMQALLITLNYRDGQINPPPFRVFGDEVETLYTPWCNVKLLQEGETEVKGHICPQFAYRLQVKRTAHDNATT